MTWLAGVRSIVKERIMKEYPIHAVTHLAQEVFDSQATSTILQSAGVIVGIAAVLAAYHIARRSRGGTRMTPRIILPVDNARIGDTITVRVEGLNRFELVDLFFTTDRVTVNVPSGNRFGLDRFQAEDDGRLNIQVTVPTGLNPGKSWIVLERREDHADPPELAIRFYVRTK
jgi:hypothetical protein